MTRYAKVKRDQRIQESNPTPWRKLTQKLNSSSELSKNEYCPNSGDLLPSTSTSNKSLCVTVNGKSLKKGKCFENKGVLSVTKTISKSKNDRKSLSPDLICGDISTGELGKKKKKKRKVCVADDVGTARLDTEKANNADPTVSNETDVRTTARFLETEGQNVTEDPDIETPSDKRSEGSQNFNDKSETSFRATGANCEMSEKEIMKIASKMMKLATLEEVKSSVRHLCKTGEIKSNYAGATIVRLWRKHYRRITHAHKKEDHLKQISESLDSEDMTIDHVKMLVNEYVQKNELSYKDAADIINKWKNRERRRIHRQIVTQTSGSCFYCRKSGHKFSECPEKEEQATMGEGICFKCGSTEHTSLKCPRRKIKGYPYATCFICKQLGHISRDCDKNPNGIYPDGGSCDLCGSQKHLKKDCSELRVKPNARRTDGLVAVADSHCGGDEDVSIGDTCEKNLTVKVKRKKIVKF